MQNMDMTLIFYTVLGTPDLLTNQIRQSMPEEKEGNLWCPIDVKGSKLGLRELCSKFSSLFYSEFPQKLYHYAHYYSQNLLIIFIILNFTAILLQLFCTFAIKMCNNTL